MGAITFHGQAAHSGSTPMNRRRDAFLAAGKMSAEIYRIAERSGAGVCTIGSCTTKRVFGGVRWLGLHGSPPIYALYSQITHYSLRLDASALPAVFYPIFMGFTVSCPHSKFGKVPECPSGFPAVQFMSYLHKSPKSRHSILTSAMAALLVIASAKAGVFSTSLLTGDSDSGISATDAFTHAIDFDGDGNTSVNGAVFSASFGGNPGMNANSPGTNNYSTTGLPNPYGTGSGFVPANVTGTIGSMLQNFNYGDATPETLTLNNLRVGQQYTTTFYSDAFGGVGGRIVDFITSDGGSLSSFDENQGGTRVAYTFTAPGASFTYTITPQSGNSFHSYAFTNRMDGYKSLFTDNFRAGGNPNTGDVNFNNTARQGGSVVFAGGPVSYSTDGNTQVGNDTGFANQPYGGDYLLSAFGARTALNHNFGGAESAGGQSISFDFIPDTVNSGDSSRWESIELGMSDPDKLTSVDGTASHFGILLRGNGGLQAFDGASLVSGSETWGAGSTNTFNHIEILLTDPTDSNPFDGIGETDIAVYSNGLLVYSYVKGGGGYVDNFTNFSSNFIGGADNFQVAQVSPVPEPSTICLLIGSLGLLASGRRRKV